MEEKLFHLLMLIRDDLHGIREALESHPDIRAYPFWDNKHTTLDEINWSIENAAKEVEEEN